MVDMMLSSKYTRSQVAFTDLYDLYKAQVYPRYFIPHPTYSVFRQTVLEIPQ